MLARSWPLDPDSRAGPNQIRPCRPAHRESNLIHRSQYSPYARPASAKPGCFVWRAVEEEIGRGQNPVARGLTLSKRSRTLSFTSLGVALTMNSTDPRCPKCHVRPHHPQWPGQGPHRQMAEASVAPAVDLQVIVEVHHLGRIAAIVKDHQGSISRIALTSLRHIP